MACSCFESQVEIIFFSIPTPAAIARSYSKGTVAESCSAMPVESNTVISLSEVRPGFFPVITSPISPAMSSSLIIPCCKRNVDFTIRAALADVVDENSGLLKNFRVKLLVAILIGTDGSDVGAGSNPFRHDDGPARRRHGHHHIGPLDHALQIGRSADGEGFVLWLLFPDESIEGFLGPAPNSNFLPLENLVACGQCRLPCGRHRQ